jgi:hypothetical protein
VWKADSDAAGRTGPQVFFAVSLLVAAVIASAAGILRMV